MCEFWSCSYYCVRFNICDESSVDSCTVLVRNRTVSRYITYFTVPPASQKSQLRPEQEKPDLVVAVKIYYFRKNRKRRVVNNYNTRAITFPLIVTAWIKRPHEFFFVEFVFFCDPVGNRVINSIRSIAIIGRFFSFKLIKEAVVLIVAFFISCIVSFSFLKPARIVNIKLEPCKVNIETFVCKFRKLKRNKSHVPFTQFGEFVVSDYVRALLSLCKPLHKHHRDFIHAE